MAYSIGIDGGNNHSEICLANEAGEVLRSVSLGTLSLDEMSASQIQRTLFQTLEHWNELQEILQVYACISGTYSHAQEDSLRSVFRELFPKAQNNIHVANEGVALLLSRNLDMQGMALVVGTSSLCVGSDGPKVIKCGGYGYREGDPGSAFDLGYHAIRHLSRVLDGRHSSTPFSDQIAKAIHVQSVSDMAAYFGSFQRREVAEIARIVTQFASIDQYAYRILAQAANEIQLMVESIFKQLSLESTTMVLGGGLANADTMYRTMIFQAISKVSNSIEIVTPKYSRAEALAKQPMLSRGNNDDRF